MMVSTNKLLKKQKWIDEAHLIKLLKNLWNSNIKRATISLLFSVTNISYWRKKGTVLATETLSQRPPCFVMFLGSLVCIVVLDLWLPIMTIHVGARPFPLLNQASPPPNFT